MRIQDVVWAIFNRWIQENDFKYLDVHYGINQLDSRASASFEENADSFEDRPVDCPEYKELKSQLKSCDDKLAKRLLKLRRENTTITKLLNQQEIISAKLQACVKQTQRDIEYLSDPDTSFKELESNQSDLIKAAKKITNDSDCSHVAAVFCCHPQTAVHCSYGFLEPCRHTSSKPCSNWSTRFQKNFRATQQQRSV